MFSNSKGCFIYRFILGWIIVVTFPFSSNAEVLKGFVALPHDFVQPKENYETLGEAFLELVTSPPTLELPDLRSIIQFYGTTGRPDMKEGGNALHFGIKGDSTPNPMPSGGRLYLTYDALLHPPQYVFSQNNQETGLWIEATTEDKEALVQVFLKNENGEIVRSPQAFSSFKLKAKELIRAKGGTWNIGSHQVDGALLARQKARWFGEDLFLKQHGGEDYAELSHKQRIDFELEMGSYFIFVGEGDCFIWKNEKWQSVKPGEDSKGYPLLVVHKIAERVIQFNLWDIEGKRKVLLNLIKSADIWNPKEICRDFRFIGSRTLRQILVEMGGERITLKPLDWIIFGDEGWKKLATTHDIDDYVDRKMTGPLFIFNEVIKNEEEQLLKGILYSTSRAQMEEIRVPIHQAVASTPQLGHKSSIQSSIERNEGMNSEKGSPANEGEEEAIQRAIMDELK